MWFPQRSVPELVLAGVRNPDGWCDGQDRQHRTAAGWREHDRQAVFRIVLPLITPSIFFAVVLTLISSFQVFTQAYVLTGGGPGNATTTMVVYLHEQGLQFYKFGLASSVAWCCSSSSW